MGHQGFTNAENVKLCGGPSYRRACAPLSRVLSAQQQRPQPLIPSKLPVTMAEDRDGPV